MRNIIFLTCILVLYSCRNNQKKVVVNTDTIPVLDIEYAYDHINQADTSFLWNDIIENVRFIPLETKEECLVGTNSHASLIGNDILIYYLFNNKTPVFLFDSTGRFIKPIALHGKGPGEINGLLLKVIPFPNNQYILFSTGYQNIIKDRNGNWIRDLKTEQSRHSYPYDSGFVYINQYDRFPNDSTFLCFTDSLGNIIKELKEPPLEERINPNLLDTPFNGTDRRELFCSDNKLWMMKNYNDTLYRITNEQTIEPYLVLYRGKYIPELNEKDKKRLTLLYNEI